MVGLDDTDPLRFTLIQWHKTFGVLILLLSVFRLVWRLTHRAPTHPAHAPAWERFAAHFSHIALYALLFIAPFTGWMLVSVSPLNVDTLLFNVVPWPHLPWLHNLADKASAVGRYEQFHEWATGAMIVLLLLHIAGALKHHFIDKDNVLTRMLPSKQAGTSKTMASVLSVIVLGVGGSVFAYSKLNSVSASLSSGTSEVSAVAMVSGNSTLISFTASSVSANLDASRPESSSLSATVPTASATSINKQVQSSLPDAEWFDSENYPDALFESTNIGVAGESQFDIEGVLTIKGIAQPHQFKLTINESETGKTASGEFTVDRLTYQLGLESQPTDEYVGNDVTISFEFELLPQP